MRFVMHGLSSQARSWFLRLRVVCLTGFWYLRCYRTIISHFCRFEKVRYCYVHVKNPGPAKILPFGEEEASEQGMWDSRWVQRDGGISHISHPISHIHEAAQRIIGVPSTVHCLPNALH